MNEVLKAIRSRRSIRAYKPERLKKEEIDTILEAGFYAPNGINTQPWHFSVIQDRQIIGEINAMAKARMAQSDMEWIKRVASNPNADITHGAPTLLIVSCEENAISGVEDCSAALENMLLAAESLNIGSCWMGFVTFVFDNAEMMNRLGVPKGYAAREVAVFGYPAEGAKKEPAPRKENLVNFIGSF